MWRRESEGLRSLENSRDHVVSQWNLNGAGEPSLPITFCKKIKRYFHPPCPRCGGALQDCRDEALLRDQGLPGYAATTTRYLYCRSCAGGGKPVFYTYALSPEEPGKPEALIRRRTQLYRDLASLVKGAAGDGDLARRFPCAGCDHRAVCYPDSAQADQAIPAESLLIPVSFYEFYHVVLEYLPLHYDELCDLLGGASWDWVTQTYDDRRAAPVRGEFIRKVERSFGTAPQFFHAHDRSGRFGVEALRLKVTAFLQLCRGLSALHARCLRPHLNLNPMSVMVDTPPAGAGLPARWNFQV
jgi:hypothetical protein